MYVVINNQRYRRVSRRDGGNYSGPCPFYNRGEDRFSFWPNADPPNWYCRKACDDCPGKPSQSGGRWGLLRDHSVFDDINVAPTESPDAPDMETVQAYVNARSTRTTAYLAQRGIKDLRTIDRFYIGEHAGRRLTIPLLRQSKNGLRCLGVKKRWLGEPPSGFVAKYIMDTGSKAKAIYNLDVLRESPRRLLIVESQLDVIFLAQFGIAAISAFAGGSSWDPTWNRYLSDVSQVFVVADMDSKRGGSEYAKERLATLDNATAIYPPFGGSDITAAYQNGYAVMKWLYLLKE